MTQLILDHYSEVSNSTGLSNVIFQSQCKSLGSNGFNSSLLYSDENFGHMPIFDHILVTYLQINIHIKFGLPGERTGVSKTSPSKLSLKPLIIQLSWVLS